MILQIFDINYISDIERNPIIQLFCIDEFGSSKVVRVHGFRPYFYATSSDINQTKLDLSKINLEFEEVNFFKPIGYQSLPTKMLKIYTVSPRDVRETREIIRSYPNVTNIYEADILFHERFAADTGIQSFRWIDVNSEDVYYKDIKLIQGIEDVPLRILSLDIECMIPEDGTMPKPEKDSITLVSLAFNTNYNNVNNIVLIAKKIECSRNDTFSCENEKDLLNTLIKIIKDYDPDIITGYNVGPFDLNYIDVRSKVNNIRFNIGRDNSLLYIKQFGLEKEAIVSGRVIIDTLPMIRRNYSLKQYTLKNVANELLHLQKLDVPAKKMREYWLSTGKDFVNFIKYSRRDAVLGLLLLQDLGMLQKYIALSKVSGALLQTVVNSGQTSILEFMILQRFNAKNRVVNMKPHVEGNKEDRKSEFQGGYVSVPKKALCENIILTDMQSLYPSIIIRYNLCPTTIIKDEEHEDIITSPNGTKFITSVRGILPEMLDELLKMRLETKSKMRASKDKHEQEVLDSIQYAYKILLNSAYGLCGYPRSRTFAMPVASSVTAYGRETIKKVRNDIENIKDLEVNSKKFNFEVIYTDTDSAYISLLCSNDITYEDANLAGNIVTQMVSKPMSYPMKLNYEGYASRALFLAKKRYAMNMITQKEGKLNQSIKVKGIEVVRRDWCQLTGETLTKVLELILQDGDPYKAWQYANSIIERLLSLQDIRNDLEFADKLILSRKIGNLSGYKNIQPHTTVYKKIVARGEEPPGLGDRIQYYALPGASSVKYGGISQCVDTPEFVKNTDGRIDNNWYVTHQIIPPLERIFECIGISILTGKKLEKESSLFEFSETECQECQKPKTILTPKKNKTGLFAFT